MFGQKFSIEEVHKILVSNFWNDMRVSVDSAERTLTNFRWLFEEFCKHKQGKLTAKAIMLIDDLETRLLLDTTKRLGDFSDNMSEFQSMQILRLQLRIWERMLEIHRVVSFINSHQLVNSIVIEKDYTLLKLYFEETLWKKFFPERRRMKSFVSSVHRRTNPYVAESITKVLAKK